MQMLLLSYPLLLLLLLAVVRPVAAAVEQGVGEAAVQLLHPGVRCFT
jgi:hypothetical protein